MSVLINRKWLCLAVGGMVLLVFEAWEPSSAAEEKPSEITGLIQRIAARYRAVFSLHMIYHYHSNLNTDYRGELTISGSSWRDRALRNDGWGGCRVTHRNKTLEHTFSPDGHWVQITLPQPLDKNFPAPPYYAGTFWFKEECRYVEKYAAEATLRGGSDLQGIHTTALEWPIPSQKRWAELAHVDHSAKGGRLRLYVAPQLGYVLPRYDYYNPRGELVQRCEADGFQESAPGIYFPRKIRRICYLKGEVGFAAYFDIESVDQVNEPIAEEAFILRLPKGTVIADSRSQTHSIMFRLGETPPVPGTEDLQEVLAELPPPARPGYSWGLAVLLGIALGLALLACLALGYRYYRRQARQTPPPSPPA
jgi:hypothetical protein